MPFLLWLIWTTALLPMAVDSPTSAGTVSAPEAGRDSQIIRMEILIAQVHRSDMRRRDIHFPEAINADKPTVATLKDRQQFVAFLRDLQEKQLGVIRAETVVATVSGQSASLAGQPGDKAKPRAVPPLRIVPNVQQDGQVHIALDITALLGGKRTASAGTVDAQVNDGQTLAFTGLVQKQIRATIKKTPILGDIPFVGRRLFTSIGYAEKEDELVVLVTPHLEGKK